MAWESWRSRIPIFVSVPSLAHSSRSWFLPGSGLHSPPSMDIVQPRNTWTVHRRNSHYWRLESWIRHPLDFCWSMWVTHNWLWYLTANSWNREPRMAWCQLRTQCSSLNMVIRKRRGMCCCCYDHGSENLQLTSNRFFTNALHMGYPLSNSSVYPWMESVMVW